MSAPDAPAALLPEARWGDRIAADDRGGHLEAPAGDAQGAGRTRIVGRHRG
jgi:hypothetical protein